MSNLIEHCDTCQRATYHKKYRVDVGGNPSRGFERWFFCVVTMAMSELVSDTKLQCLECGKTRVI